MPQVAVPLRALCAVGLPVDRLLPTLGIAQRGVVLLVHAEVRIVLLAVLLLVPLVLLQRRDARQLARRAAAGRRRAAQLVVQLVIRVGTLQVFGVQLSVRLVVHRRRRHCRRRGGRRLVVVIDRVGRRAVRRQRGRAGGWHGGRCDGWHGGQNGLWLQGRWWRRRQLRRRRCTRLLRHERRRRWRRRRCRPRVAIVFAVHVVHDHAALLQPRRRPRLCLLTLFLCRRPGLVVTAAPTTGAAVGQPGRPAAPPRRPARSRRRAAAKRPRALLAGSRLASTLQLGRLRDGVCSGRPALLAVTERVPHAAAAGPRLRAAAAAGLALLTASPAQRRRRRRRRAVHEQLLDARRFALTHVAPQLQPVGRHNFRRRGDDALQRDEEVGGCEVTACCWYDRMMYVGMIGCMFGWVGVCLGGSVGGGGGGADAGSGPVSRWLGNGVLVRTQSDWYARLARYRHPTQAYIREKRLQVSGLAVAW
eukprot:351432-Chlamydomonas_euryale.AAC.1